MWKQKLLIVLLMSSPVSVLAFPEIPFCPLGGPPGWFNRMSGDYRQTPYLPAWYPPPQHIYQGYPQYPAPAWRPVNGGDTALPSIQQGQ